MLAFGFVGLCALRASGCLHAVRECSGIMQARPSVVLGSPDKPQSQTLDYARVLERLCTWQLTMTASRSHPSGMIVHESARAWASLKQQYHDSYLTVVPVSTLIIIILMLMSARY